MWAIHYQDKYHHHSLLTLAVTVNGARINLANDWAMIPLDKRKQREDDKTGEKLFPRPSRDKMLDLAGCYTRDMQDLVRDEEEMVQKHKWTDAAKDDKGLSFEERNALHYQDQPSLLCLCMNEQGKKVWKYFYTLSGVIAHAWIDRVKQRSVYVSALDG